MFLLVLFVFVFFWSDGFCQAVATASSSSSASREHELQHTAGLSVFKVLGLSHTAAPLAFIFVCLFVVVFVLFFLCLSLSDVGMLRFQTSVALWDRSSVSAGSVTVSLYQLRCLVEAWVFPKLCFFFFYFYFFNILFYYIIIFLFVFWVGLGVFFVLFFVCFF